MRNNPLSHHGLWVPVLILIGTNGMKYTLRQCAYFGEALIEHSYTSSSLTLEIIGQNLSHLDGGQPFQSQSALI